MIPAPAVAVRNIKSAVEFELKDLNKMIDWWDNNFRWILILFIAAIGKIISNDFWVGKHPISIYIAVLCLGLLVYLSYCFIQFVERLLLLSAYLWVCWNIILIFSAIYMKFGLHEKTPNTTDTLYLSISVWTLLGFGSVLPSEASRYWVQVEAISGLLANGLLVSLFVRLFAPWQQLATKARD